MKHNKWIITFFLVLSFFAKIVLVPVFLSLFLAMLLEPAVKFLIDLKLSRTLASTMVTAGLGVFTLITGWLLYTATLEFAVSLPTFVSKANEWLGKIEMLSAKISPSVGQAPMQLFPASDWTHFALSNAGIVLENASVILFFVPLLMFYFLVDKENLLESFNILNGRYFNLPKLNYELPRMLRLFFAANLLTGAFLVMFQGIALLILGYENWITLALLSGFLNLLPIVGGFFAVAAVLVLGIGVKITLTLVFVLGLVILGLHLIANNLIVPIFVGSRININPVAMIIGLLFWSWIWGVAGFLLAVPMTALVKILLECNKETYAFANLMASKPKRMLSGRGSEVIDPAHIIIS